MQLAMDQQEGMKIHQVKLSRTVKAWLNIHNYPSQTQFQTFEAIQLFRRAAQFVRNLKNIKLNLSDTRQSS